MTIDELEELIKKYFSTGVAVVVILVAPGTGRGDAGAPADGASPSGSPVATTAPARPAPTTAPRSGAAAPSRTGRPTAGPTTPVPLPRPRPTGSAAPTASASPIPTRRPSADPQPSGTREPTGAPEPTVTPDPGKESPDPGQEEPTGSNSTGEGRAGGDGTGGDTGSDTGGDTGGESGGDTGDRTGASGSDPGRDDSGNGGDGDGNGGGVTTPPAAGGAPSAGTGANASDGTTAAASLGWGTPNREDDFSGGADQWSIYDGPGHAGQGTRSPSAVSIKDGLLTITGDSSGTTAGMAWNPGQKYGRWEGRVRAPVGDPSYNALLLLWPDAEDFPVGGELDFMEISDDTRQKTELFLHYGSDNSQVQGDVQIDATQWHNWAVEWTPESITAYVDGKEWYKTTDTSIFPPGPMHLCIQLDWFPEGDSPKETTMQVDWVRQYSLDGTATTGEAGGGKPDAAATGADDASPVRTVIRRMFSWR